MICVLSLIMFRCLNMILPIAISGQKDKNGRHRKHETCR